MYRSSASRLLQALCRRNGVLRTSISLHRTEAADRRTRFCSSASSETVPNQKPSSPEFTRTLGAASSAATLGDERSDRRESEASSSRGARPRAKYQDEQFRVLTASLSHVNRVGWTEAAMVAGAKDIGVSPSIVGSFAHKEAALVEFFMDECLQKLIDVIDTTEELKILIPSERVGKLVRTRLEMQAPYISKWAQVLSIQAQPFNISTSFKQRAMLVDEIWHAVGDEATDLDWYVKRTILGGIYSTTELYMLTDKSQDFRDTWAFLDGRIKDAFDLKKSVQEAKYLAEAVGAGMGGSLEGLFKKVLNN